MSWMKGRAELVTLIVTILVILAGVASTYGVSQLQLNNHERDIETIKKDVDSNQNILIEVRNDVKWLRHKLAE